MPERGRAVRWIDEGKAGRNVTDVGRLRAHPLANGESLSDGEVKKIHAYIAALRRQAGRGASGGGPDSPAQAANSATQ